MNQRLASEDISRWLQDGKLTPRIDRELPLSDAAKAHQFQEDSTIRLSGAVSGKIVLTP